MNLDLQLTTQTKLLIGILGLVLIIALVTQWGPGLYKMFSDEEMAVKKQTLQTSKDLVAASRMLIPIEVGLFEKTGLAEEGQDASIFNDNFPETVIRSKITSIVKEAGIPRNYQWNMEPIPGKKTEKISPHARRNLINFLYLEKLKTERDILQFEIEDEQQTQEDAEVQAEEEMMDLLMNAWLDETEDIPEKEEHESNNMDIEENEDEASEDIKEDDSNNRDIEENEDEDKIENGIEKQQDGDVYTDKADSDMNQNQSNEEDFVSLPEDIPITIRVELIDVLLSMIEQQLVGAETTLFEKEFYKLQKESKAGFFGFGSKKPSTEISFNPNSQILSTFLILIKDYESELDKKHLSSLLLQYLENIQTQIEELTKGLRLAPSTYTPESYSIKIKFKAELDKLVNLNRIIETSSKWLMVRDLKISTDNKQDKITVELFLIARIYQ
ncbi:hypothetical protein JT359_06305 [Candidatus Poribacteria bacterium]|nr:hypothetical protein [Candidatus Poribacteria bacterium]